ncbi:peptidoglycan DD-metalloendopeptidase family protein [Cryomorphaceae bacterium]|nr:peptidoglycan DD-metalloendopeptidase family protein [Cryomorphaceae bacterium]
MIGAKQLFGALSLLILVSSCTSSKNEGDDSGVEADSASVEVREEFGIPVDQYVVVEDKIKNGQNLSELLLPYGVDYPTIDRIARTPREVFDIRRIQAGKPYKVYCTEDSILRAECFVYQPTPADYVVVDLRDSLNVYRGQKEIEVREKHAAGVIESSLWNAMVDNDMSPALVMELSAIYAWTLDFFRVKKGDKFKVIYEEKYVDGEYLGVGRVRAVEFVHMGETYPAYYFEEEEAFGDYFDDAGDNLRRVFLMAPVEYSRISSRYTKRRFHPVQKRWKAHLGTDYAAPHGTPIYSTADGVVTKRGYTRGNGNYVKVRHNSTYETQYLHMSKFVADVKVGTRVRQGQAIGYVGSTGLATGPHVCYRFWKNGVQVDPFKEDLPPSEPIKDENRARFDALKASRKKQLQDIHYPGVVEDFESPEETPIALSTSQ